MGHAYSGCEQPVCGDDRGRMYLAVPLSWSLSLFRPVTLRPNLSVGLPFDSYLAALSAMALLACDSATAVRRSGAYLKSLARNCLSAPARKTLARSLRRLHRTPRADTTLGRSGC